MFQKAGFTMIELIFVVVILGVLASVAIPRFVATRDDAKVSVIAKNVMMGASEIASYAMANARTEDDLKAMSYAVASLEGSGNAVLTNKRAVISIGEVSNCLTLEIQTDATNDNLILSLGNADGDDKCMALQAAIDAAEYPMKLRGKNVNY